MTVQDWLLDSDPAILLEKTTCGKPATHHPVQLVQTIKGFLRRSKGLLPSPMVGVVSYAPKSQF